MHYVLQSALAGRWPLAFGLDASLGALPNFKDRLKLAPCTQPFLIISISMEGDPQPPDEAAVLRLVEAWQRLKEEPSDKAHANALEALRWFEAAASNTAQIVPFAPAAKGATAISKVLEQLLTMRANTSLVMMLAVEVALVWEVLRINPDAQPQDEGLQDESQKKTAAGQQPGLLNAGIQLPGQLLAAGQQPGLLNAGIQLPGQLLAEEGAGQEAQPAAPPPAARTARTNSARRPHELLHAKMLSYVRFLNTPILPFLRSMLQTLRR